MGKDNIKVMVIGAGGNNSWFLHEIDELIKKHQIPQHVEFTIFDGDTVETKNLGYQDFGPMDVLENKAEVLGNRYAMAYRSKYITKAKEFDPYDVVICGVDNRDLRHLMYRYMDEHPDKYWIDLRAEGNTVCIYTKHDENTLKVLEDSLPPEGTGATSCQREYELTAGIIQLGNKIAAVIGAQFFLNYLRGEFNVAKFVHMF